MIWRLIWTDRLRNEVDMKNAISLCDRLMKFDQRVGSREPKENKNMKSKDLERSQKKALTKVPGRDPYGVHIYGRKRKKWRTQ